MPLKPCKLLFIFLVLTCRIKVSISLMCYNCSSTHRNLEECGGDFAKPALDFHTTREHLVNCTGGNSMCFVRLWSARAKHAWIVQRGCYQVNAEDPFPRAMDTPTRSMTCKQERLPDAEYKVCLCQADWCNSASAENTKLQHSAKGQLLLLYYVYSFIYFLCAHH